MDDPSFRKLLDAFDLSWEGYRKVRKGVKKRISRHMHELSCPSMARYLDVVDSNHEERRQCELLLTVPISRFFRDRHLWAAIEKEILPNLLNNKIDRIKVWSACCANGEEAYSFKMIWDLVTKRFGNTPTLEILATDINPDCLKRAKNGSYSQSSLKEIPKDYINRYFDLKRNGNHFFVKPSLKKDITWKIHHMLSDPPGAVFHIIFLRNNILTYYQDHINEQVFRKIHARLCPAGYLIIG
ncbi:MAG: hypothetical protein JRJ76_01840 [Deltaproteobacteria bacterium]|nr:hypothetical protein [Deltaproteobacteria bacterium]